MAEFKRSRLTRKADEQITRKTVFLGVVTMLLFLSVVIFGLPLLIKFSVFLGNARKTNDVIKEKVLPPQAPRPILPFEATNTAKINLSGVAEPNVKVVLLKSDVNLMEEMVSGEGTFVFENIELDKGENIFNMIAESEKSGTSDLSKQIKIIYDDQAPTITMENPAEDSITVDSIDFDVSGKTEKDVSVSINGHVAMVDDSGNFKLKIQLNAGDNDVEIVARDLAENETRKKVKIKCNI
jgi:hypothetical protein